MGGEVDRQPYGQARRRFGIRACRRHRWVHCCDSGKSWVGRLLAVTSEPWSSERAAEHRLALSRPEQRSRSDRNINDATSRTVARRRIL